MFTHIPLLLITQLTISPPHLFLVGYYMLSLKPARKCTHTKSRHNMYQNCTLTQSRDTACYLLYKGCVKYGRIKDQMFYSKPKNTQHNILTKQLCVTYLPNSGREKPSPLAQEGSLLHLPLYNCGRNKKKCNSDKKKKENQP